MTNPTKPLSWERKERLKIVSLGIILDDIDRSQEWGDRLTCTILVYKAMLLRRLYNEPTSAIQYQLMKDSVEEIDEFQEALYEQEAESLKGWAYGMDSGANLAWGTATLLVGMRNDLLFAIGNIMRHKQTYDSYKAIWAEVSGQKGSPATIPLA
jgi:hypothetical protein